MRSLLTRLAGLFGARVAYASVAADGSVSGARDMTAFKGPGPVGVYEVYSTGVRTDCGWSVSLSGTAPGSVAIVPKHAATPSPGVMIVSTFDAGGSPADRAFRVLAVC